MQSALSAITIVHVCMSVNLDSNRGGGYLNPIFWQHHNIVYNIFPHPPSGFTGGGGYLNLTISQPQYMVTSLNPVQIQTGGGYLNPTIS